MSRRTLDEVSTPQPPLRPGPESFDNLYRAELASIPWDIRQAQPALMELEALGGFSGEVLDIGCGLGDNAIYLASRGHQVTGIDGSPAAIEQARDRAAAAGVQLAFGVADATDLTGYDGRFDTVLDSGLYHCLDDDGRARYAAGLYRATRPGACWHLYCFADGNVNGVIAPMGSVPESNIRDTLTSNGWRIDFLGPTTYLGNAAGFHSGDSAIPEQLAAQLPPEELEQIRDVADQFEKIAERTDGERVHLPFTVVHAHRVD